MIFRSMGPENFKIPKWERFTNYPYLREIAKLKRVILSTGMSQSMRDRASS